MFNNFHKKEKPFTGMSGLGGGFLRFKSGSGFAVSGGTLVPAGIEPGNGYKYHVFTSPGNLEVTGKAGTVEFLIVAGGGGPINGSGGGGGGGVLHHPGREFDVGTHPVTVGAGGPNTEGADSVLVDANGPTTWTATGGGKSNMRSAGTAGGSGGGGGWGGSGGPGTQSPSNGATGYGNNGSGAGTDGPGAGQQSGGGGGAGAAATGYDGGAGQPFPAFAGPVVQNGIPSPNRTAFNSAVGPTGLYAGGGGGGQGSNHSNTSGGPGGGGAGKAGHPNAGDPGVYATGGGGGGGGTIPPTQSPGGSGGPGVVIIRYAV